MKFIFLLLGLSYILFGILIVFFVKDKVEGILAGGILVIFGLLFMSIESINNGVSNNE